MVQKLGARQHVHFYMNGGKQTFAAVCAEVYIADKAAFCSCGYC